MEVSFYQGNSSSYNSSSMEGAIYFATDTKEILMNGDTYGGSSNGSVSSGSLSGNTLTLTMSDGSTVKITLNDASTSASGLMSTSDKTLLDNLSWYIID